MLNTRTRITLSITLSIEDMYIHWLKGNDMLENESFQASFIAMSQKACEQMQESQHAYQVREEREWTEVNKE